MRFYYVRGDQHLDLRGNLILTHNKEIITAPAKSAAPKVHNAVYFCVRKHILKSKIKATVAAINFIWWGRAE